METKKIKLAIKNLPESPGVYIFKDKNNKVLYVGKAVNVKKRVASYLQKGLVSGKTLILVSKTFNVKVIPVFSELEALLLEAHLIKTHQPFFNIRAKDDKRPLYIKITAKDEFPRVFLVRREEDLTAQAGKGNLYFGPFPSSQTVKKVLRLLRGIFPYDTQKTVGKRPCFWSHLGLCNPCPSIIKTLPISQKKVETKKYRQNIRQLLRVLSRKTEKVKSQLKREMTKLANYNRFEEAAQIRDKIAALDYVTQPYQSISTFLENPNLISEVRREETRELFKILKSSTNMIKIPEKIECFDASHTSRANPVVGMVTFNNGEPDKNLYRKFRIRNQKSGDDLSYLEEALRRRFSHREWREPDLLVIDGGKTQVGRAKKILFELNLVNIPLIGLVKPFDDIVIPHQDGFQVMRIRSGPALQILQRVRDEAHRFAKAYHVSLRNKFSLTFF